MAPAGAGHGRDIGATEYSRQTAEELGSTEGRIAVGEPVTARPQEDLAVRFPPFQHAMQVEAASTVKKDDVLAPHLADVAPVNFDHIAGTNRRCHAGSLHPQGSGAPSPENIGEQLGPHELGRMNLRNTVVFGVLARILVPQSRSLGYCKPSCVSFTAHFTPLHTPLVPLASVVK